MRRFKIVVLPLIFFALGAVIHVSEGQARESISSFEEPELDGQADEKNHPHRILPRPIHVQALPVRDLDDA